MSTNPSTKTSCIIVSSEYFSYFSFGHTYSAGESPLW